MNRNKRQKVRLKVNEKIFFMKRLAMLLRSGVPILLALQIMQERATTAPTKFFLNTILGQIEQGQELSRALEVFPNLYSPFVLSMVRVGETAGTLPESLQTVAVELQKQYAFRRRVIGALLYPALIGCSTIGIAFFLIGYIFPKILPILESFHFPLPWSTRLLMAVSFFFETYWYMVVGASGIMVIGVLVCLRQPRVRQAMEMALLRLPFLRSFIRAYCLGYAFRMLSVMLASGTSVVRGVALVAEVAPNHAYREAFLLTGKRLEAGETLAESFRLLPRSFTSDDVQMIAVGEETGRLVESLEYLAAMYEEEVQVFSNNLSVLIEPVLMLAMGLTVGFVAISIITPIYGITQHLQI